MTDYSAKRRDQAQRTQAEIEAIRSNNFITPDGKRAQIARAYIRGMDVINGYDQAEKDGRQARSEALEERLLGRPYSHDQGAGVIAWRDAQERAGALTSQDQERAVSLMSAAIAGKDDTLIRAILRRAIEERWADVVNLYSQRHPATASQVQELWDLTADKSNDLAAILGGLLGASSESIPLPQELYALGSSQIRKLAEDADKIENAARARLTTLGY